MARSSCAWSSSPRSAAIAATLAVLTPSEWRAGVFVDVPLLWWTTLASTFGAVLYLHVARVTREDNADADKSQPHDDAGASRALNLLLAFGAVVALVAPARRAPHATTTQLMTGAIACVLGNQVVLRDARARDRASMLVVAAAHTLGHVACALVIVGVAFEVSRARGLVAGGARPH